MPPGGAENGSSLRVRKRGEVDMQPSAACEKGESISVAGACMSFGHASNGPDFDTDSSRNVNLLRLIALASSI